MSFFIRNTAITLAVLTGCSGFLYADIHADLLNVNFAIRVTYNNNVIDTTNSNLYGGGNNVSITSSNWTGHIVFVADYNGQNKISVETTIDGITSESSSQFTWNGAGYAGTFTTSNGYTIEVADQSYFSDEPDPDPEPEPTASSDLVPYFYRLELVGAFMIGILLWQILIKSWRSQSLYI